MDCVVFSGGGVRCITGYYDKRGCLLVELTIDMK